MRIVKNGIVHPTLNQDHKETDMAFWMLCFSLAVSVNVLLLVIMAKQGNMFMIGIICIVLGWLTTVFRNQVETWRKK